MNELAALLIGIGASWYVLDRLHKRATEERERIMRQQSEHIFDLARALNRKDGTVDGSLTQADVDRIVERGRAEYGEIEEEADGLEDGEDFTPTDWDAAWGDYVWTPEHRRNP